MALFVLIVVGLVVAQTWLDWRDTNKDWALPAWARGAALAGVIAVSLTAATSFASSWIRDEAGSWTDALGSRFLWQEAAFLFCMMGIVVFAARKKRLRLVLILAGMLVAAFWIGMTLSL
jgi:hypothetical protein